MTNLTLNERAKFQGKVVLQTGYELNLLITPNALSLNIN